MSHPTFLNLSNHPVAGWAPEQVAAAEALGFGPPVDFDGGFPNVDPEASAEEIKHLARELVDRILALHPGAIFVAGEFTLAFGVVHRLLEAGIRCVSATTRRVVRERVRDDGTMERLSEFKFVQWRRYR